MTFHAPPPPPAALAGGVPPPPPPSVTPSIPPPPPPPTDRSPPPPPPPSAAAAPPRKVARTAQPLSVEVLLAQKKAADDAAARPKFLSKAARESLARQKQRREEEAAKQKEEEEVARRREMPPPRTNGVAHGKQQRGPPSAPRGMMGRTEGQPPRGPAAMRGRTGNGHEMGPAKGKTGSGGDGVTAVKKPSEQEVEAAMTRQRYMGADTNTSTFSAKKKRKRTTEKKFNFEWNVEEDTSPDYNPLYSSRSENISLFGRGKLGGFADDESDGVARAYARAVQERDREAGADRAREILDMERRRREEGARMGIDKHWSEKRLDQMRERDWRIFKEDFNIATKGGAIPNPMRSWEESALPRRILEMVAKVGYKEPSAVQRAAIPIALQSRDLIGVAVTGSGKTAAFLLPLLVYISELPQLDESSKHDGPYAVILAPTRELAQQIELEAKRFASPLGFTCVSLVGGHSIEEQSYNMRDGAEIIIATPGRLVDCIERRVLVLSQCCYVIMDEADRMIDLGFEEPVNRILDALPVSNQKPDSDEAEDATAMSRPLLGGGRDRYRQTMMYTATMPAAVERIARKYLRRPAIVTIGNIGEAVDTVEQRVEFIAGEDKRKKRLNEILSSREFAPPIIIFVNIKRNCDAVARDIGRMGFSAVTLHGSKTQDQREAALAGLRAGRTDVLVATDLAGRGIDVADVSLVVNFNMAPSIEAYTHRVGRTGRAGKTGVAITFLGNEDADVLYDLRQMIAKSEISRVPDELRRHEAAQQRSSKSAKRLEEAGGKGGWGER